MFAKLAFRNVKRQTGNYLIYFITVSLTVALMFAVNNAVYSRKLLEMAEKFSEFNSVLITITVFVALIVTFVLGYATSFMLKLRKREFGTYLTMGMTRKDILTIFVMETAILCAVSIAVGLLVGFFLYQGLMLAIMRLMEMEYVFEPYSLKGLLTTVGIVLAIFAGSSLTSMLYLRKARIYDLISGDKKVDKVSKHPIVWFILTLVSLAAVILSVVMFYTGLREMMKSGSGAEGTMLWMALFAAALIVYHVALSKSLVNLLLKSKRIGSVGTNTFTLRQLSGRMNGSAALAGGLSFLIAFAVIGSNFSFMQKAVTSASLDKYYPYDVMCSYDAGEPPAIPVSEAEERIQKYRKIERKQAYTVYTDGSNYLHGFTKWSGPNYESLRDSFISLSDFNRIYIALGYDAISLDGGFRILADDQTLDSYDFTGAKLKFGDRVYAFQGKQTVPVQIVKNCYFFAVVPDSAIDGLEEQTFNFVYDLEPGEYDAVKLQGELSYLDSYGDYSYERSDFYLREYGKIQSNANAAVFVVSALYIAIVFVFLSMAILALKTLSGIGQDKIRYGILFRLGADDRDRKRALFREIFYFFLLPFALPFLLSIPIAFICADLMTLSGYAALAGAVALNAGLIAAVFLIIYCLYFAATYYIAKKSILKDA